MLGWSGVAKVLCILHHRGVQLILAYSWARPAIIVAGKGRGWMFLFFLFLLFHSCFSFFPVPRFHLFYSSTVSLSLFSLSLEDGTKWPTRADVSLNHNTINQSDRHANTWCTQVKLLPKKFWFRVYDICHYLIKVYTVIQSTYFKNIIR